MMFANTHNHSTFSDGVYTPEELAALAKQEGYKAIVLTDHDTVQGSYFMDKAARQAGLLTILGCEFTTVGYGTGFHLVGFDFNPNEPEMRELLTHGALKERKRTKLLFDRAVAKGSIKGITWEEVCDAYPYNEYLCNNHIFNVMVKKGLYQKEDYLAFFDPDFKWNPETEQEIQKIIQMEEPDVHDVIRIIRKAGGVPVLAHPHAQIQYIDDLMQAGLMGVETRHKNITDEETVVLTRLAEENGLYQAGGTDHSGVLGGFLDLSDYYKVDPCRACTSEENFMKLYRRELG